MKGPEMIRTGNVATLLAIGIVMCLAASAKADYQPRPGYWKETLVSKNDTVPSHPFTISSSSYPATCVSGLQATASKIEQSNGYVWVDKTFQILSYSEQPGIADIKYEVIEFKCIFNAWPAPESK
jgi:hypothetical protein